jgi:hypothetical protein
MTRPRHAMRPHPLRSPGVVVGVPVAAAVAFGAHAVLGILPVADQHGAPTTSSAPSAAPTAAAPVQGYGLAPTPPPTTLGLLSAPGTDHGSTSGSGVSTVPIAGSPAAAHHTGTPAQTVPITRAAGAPAPSMMTFAPARAAAAPAAPAPAAAAPAAVAAPAAAPAAVAAPAARTAQRDAAPAAPAQDDEGSSDQGSSGGSLLGVDLGVAKVSVLSFGD